MSFNPGASNRNKDITAVAYSLTGITASFKR